MQRDLLAVDERDLRQLETELRGSGYASGFLDGRNTALNGLSAARHDKAVHHDRLREHRAKGVANLIMIGGDGVRGPHGEPGASRKR